MTSNENGSSNMFNLVLLPDGMGYGWCVDPGTPSPTQNDVEFTGPVKLTHVKPLLTADRAPWGPNFEEMSQPVEFQNEGVRRDAVIHVVKELRKALDARDQDRVKKLHQALQLLIGSYVGQMLTNLGRTATGSTDYGWAIDNEFLEGETGFRAVGASDGVLEYTGNSTEPIPEADPDEFITIASPVDYDVTDNGPRRNSAQRTVLIDQPGLKEEDDEEEETPEPSESEEPTPSTTSPSEEPVPEREPSIGTTAEFGEDSEQVVVAGSVVTDSVEYQDLVPNTDYRLEASLVDKQDESRVLGTASKDVRTGDESDGVFTIDIPVDDDVVEPVESAVVFERLVSDVVDASGAESDEDGNVIAVHEDIDDEGQTVVSEETPSGSPSESESEEPAPSTNPSKPEKGEQPRKVEISTNAKLAPGEELVEGATVIDEVHFEGLTPGKKYTLEGELICKATEEPTGAKESIDFVAIESEGSIKLPIKVTDGECGEQVVFETLRDSDGEVIATHHDVDDEAQTVTHEDEAKPKDESEEPVDDEPEGENVTFLVDDRPEVGIPSAPNAERQEITSVPTGSDRLAPGIPAYV
ncbi:VaFE repeat-containing surface-anchored protein [Corynebacterium otitidis]|uniref:VaFE repeat-containing surface-anchored protein n=1 Tax=Corynebacterium otitidis TaxID=29321 RepID=UPI0011AE31E9|nr:VaFE repeat-containing surface-anchored protein [Corynebacterium otitidis]